MLPVHVLAAAALAVGVGIGVGVGVFAPVVLVGAWVNSGSRQDCTTAPVESIYVPVQSGSTGHGGVVHAVSGNPRLALAGVGVTGTKGWFVL